MARSGCGRSCGIRPSTGRQTSTAATLLRIPPPAACVGQKRNSPGSGRRNRRSSRRRAALLLPMPQSKSLLLSREKIPLLPDRSRRLLAERGRQQTRQNAAQKAAKVKAKDTYIGAQTETQVTVAAEPQRQGQRVFMEERGRKAARWQAEQKRAVSRRRDQDGTSLTFRQGRQRHAGQECVRQQTTAHQRTG